MIAMMSTVSILYFIFCILSIWSFAAFHVKIRKQEISLNFLEIKKTVTYCHFNLQKKELPIYVIYWDRMEFVSGQSIHNQQPDKISCMVISEIIVCLRLVVCYYRELILGLFWTVLPEKVPFFL